MTLIFVSDQVWAWPDTKWYGWSGDLRFRCMITKYLRLSFIVESWHYFALVHLAPCLLHLLMKLQLKTLQSLSYIISIFSCNWTISKNCLYWILSTIFQSIIGSSVFTLRLKVEPPITVSEWSFCINWIHIWFKICWDTFTILFFTYETWKTRV